MGIGTIGHVELLCPDLDASRAHFTDIVGLEESGADASRVYLRAWGDWYRHTLILADADTNGLGHLAFQVETPSDLETFDERIEESGYATEWLTADAEPGQGRALRFEGPTNHTWELYYDMEKADIPEGRRSALRNQPQKITDRGIAPRRLDHATLFVPNVEECSNWLQEVLGFKLREYLVDGDGTTIGTWMSVTPLVHEIALVDADRPAFNHVAFAVKREADIYRAADILKDYNVPITSGPGQHGIAQGSYVYHRTPSDNQVELYAGGYLVLDPRWEPIRWTTDDLPEAVYWWGKERVWSPIDSPSYSNQEYQTADK